MTQPAATPAAILLPSPGELVLTGSWTARAMAGLQAALDAIELPARAPASADATRIEALDTAGAWLLQGLQRRLAGQDVALSLHGLRPEFVKLLDAVAKQQLELAGRPPVAASRPLSVAQGVGRGVVAMCEQGLALLAFVGETAATLAHCTLHPRRWRVRPILYNIRSAGLDALPIVGLLSFLLGVVVAYQGADQLRRYGASIFVADLVGLSMLREFAPLITAIIVAGRSGSAYAAQIGTMTVTEEIDAMRTLGIVPFELLVLPKLIALVIALPLLTVFADVLGVLGGMLMAQWQLGVAFNEFLDRFVKAVSVSTYLIGVGKAPVFAAIIVVVGCFQGFRTHGGADSVGRQTTRSVVQSIFLVIVADALFSVAFSALHL